MRLLRDTGGRCKFESRDGTQVLSKPSSTPDRIEPTTYTTILADKETCTISKHEFHTLQPLNVLDTMLTSQLKISNTKRSEDKLSAKSQNN